MAARINYTKYMQEKPHKKTLRIKLAFIILFGISIPTLAFFFTKNPQVTILTALISFGLTLFATFFTLKPLQTFLKGAEALGDGNMNFRVDIRSKDEFEDVGSSFNLMADKILKNFQKLEQDKNLASLEKNRLDMVLSSIVDGIIALDYSRNIVFVNKAAEYLTGYLKQDMHAKPVDNFVHLFNNMEQLTSRTYCQAGYNQSLLLVDKNGKQTKVIVTTSTASEGIQTSLSCILVLHDISKEEELEQMKFDFVSMASHELKTPLTNIIGYLSVFINENRNKVERGALELLDRSLVSAKILLTLVENLLSVNKIEREQLSVIVGAYDYQNVLKRAVDDLQNQAKLKNIILMLNFPKTPLPKVLLDPIRVQEVINNLISNAIKYTQSGGRVDVSIETTPTEVITTIADTGVGIPKEAIPHLFNKFFRVSNIEQKVSKGTGLGLFIAKSIIEKLNGKIWLESQVGKGSKFHFSLPTVSQTQANLSNDRVISETIQSGALNY